MKQVKPFYSVYEVNRRFVIRFVEPPNWQIQQFGDRGYKTAEIAITEFKKYERHQRSGKLTNTAFEGRISHHKQEMEKLKQWESMAQEEPIK